MKNCLAPTLAEMSLLQQLVLTVERALEALKLPMRSSNPIIPLLPASQDPSQTYCEWQYQTQATSALQKQQIFHKTLLCFVKTS